MIMKLKKKLILKMYKIIGCSRKKNTFVILEISWKECCLVTDVQVSA